MAPLHQRSAYTTEAKTSRSHAIPGGLAHDALGPMAHSYLMYVLFIHTYVYIWVFPEMVAPNNHGFSY